MDDITALQAEVERLRDLLIENDIDPEPYVAQPEQFGPPTRFQQMVQKESAKLFAQTAVRLWRRDASLQDLNYAADGELIGREIRIRLPIDYTATP